MKERITIDVENMFTYDVFFVDEGRNLLYEQNVSLGCLEDVVQHAILSGHRGIVIYPFSN